MAILTRAQILNAPLPHREVDIPEWGGAVRIQQMTVDARVRYLEALWLNNEAIHEWSKNELLDDKDKSKKRLVKPAKVDEAALAIAICLVDHAGERMFADHELDQLNKLSFVSIRNLFAAVIDLNDFNKSTPVQVQAEKKG